MNSVKTCRELEFLPFSEFIAYPNREKPRCFLKSSSQVLNQMDHRIDKVVSFIESDSARRIRLSELSRMVNLSPWRLSHLFKQETGTSVVRFVHAMRITEAKRLLENTCLSIKEIRTMVGFADESNFIRAFEKAHHTSPSEYRSFYWSVQARIRPSSKIDD